MDTQAAIVDGEQKDNVQSDRKDLSNESAMLLLGGVNPPMRPL